MHIVECLTHSTFGGAQKVVFTLVEQLRALQLDFRFTVAFPARGAFGRRFKEAGVEVVELPLNDLSPSSLRRSRHTLRSLQPDVLHSHGKGAGVHARLLSQDILPARRVHSYHGFHLPRGMLSHVYLATERWLLHRTSEIIAVSESEAQELRMHFPSALPSVTIIPNVVNCAELYAASTLPLPSEYADFFARNAGKKVVLMIARDDPVKNYPLAVNAAQQVLESEGNVAFAFIGNERAARDLAEFAARVLGIASTANPAPFLHRADIVLLTSTKESSPLVIQEAFCFGKPVVATNVAGIREIIAENTNGILCFEQASSIAQAVRVLITNSGLYDRLAQGALKSAASRDVRQWALRYAAVYRQGAD